MKRRRPLVPQRTLYFAGCEGDCERAYVALLNRLAGLRGLHIRVQGEALNPGAGDPLALVERAAERLAHRRRQRTSYRHAAIFLDEDRAGASPNRTAKAQRIARDSSIQLIWQRPNFEALLLRHLDGCQHLQPSADRSLAELQRRWPEYDKSGISADKLAHRIGYQNIVQVAQVEAQLFAFLDRIGLI